MLQQRQTSAWAPSFDQCAAILNLLGFLWLLGFLPAVRFHQIAEAAVYVLAAWALSTYVTWALAAVHRPRQWVVQNSLAGVWLAPGLALLLARWPLFVLGGFFLLAGAAHVLTNRLLLASFGRWWPPLAMGIISSLLLQVAGLLVVARAHLSAAAMVMTAAGITTVTSRVIGASSTRAARQPLTATGVALTVVLATIVAAIAMIDAVGPDGAPPFPFTRALVARLSGDAGPGVPIETFTATQLYEPPDTRGVTGTTGVAGVILRPKPLSERPLTVPRLGDRARTEASPQQAIRIPFTGEYWLYQAPLKAPTRASLLKVGDPYELSFRTGNVSLFMEARQSLGRMVPVTCCSRVDLEVRQNSPLQSESLELILINTLGGQSQSLGQARVRSLGGTLAFRMPRQPGLAAFDAIRVRYHRSLFPTQSSRLAIDAVLLIPQ